jgi:two-component sensor histidine kinase
MYDLVQEYLKLSEAEGDFLRAVQQQIGIIADLSRADILLYSRKSEIEAVVLAHARPHSLAHVYSKNRKGRVIGTEVRPEVWRALMTGRSQKEHFSHISEGASVIRQTLPLIFPPPFPELNDHPQTYQPRTIGVLVIVTNLIEYERHRLRSKIFRRALKKLQLMGLYGQVHGTENLTPFGEQDGILFVDDEGFIRYASGIAGNLFRRLGYRETLVGRPLAVLETDDEVLRREAVAQNMCLERESKEGDRVFIRKVVPLQSYPVPYWQWLKRLGASQIEQRYGTIITLHDDTESRRQDEEIRIKNAMIQEVHHRVKNNLQTIAGLLRMQIRRVNSEEAKEVLGETLHRILSIAVIHEFLSYENSNIINLKDVSHRIANQLQQGALDPEKQIRFEVKGEPIYLPARQATASSLVLNELLQNAIEHGFTHKQSGTIQINLEDGGDEVMINVTDDGDGLPENFQLNESDSLGLQIIRILVEGDLRGKIQVHNHLNDENGVSITITFPKVGFTGEEGWKEHVSL